MVKRVYYFAGTGGTGKTKVMERVLEICTQGMLVVTRNKEVTTVHPVVKINPSVSRAFYASKNVKDESTMMAWPEADRYQFQQELFQYYLDKTEKVLEEQLEMVDFMLCDRSPLDHFAYLTYNSQSSLTLDDISGGVNEAVALLEHTPSVIFQFRYPQSWSPNFKDPDNFRSAHPGKNLIIATLIRHYIEAAQQYASPLTNSRDWRNWIVDEGVEERALQIVNHMIRILIPDGLSWSPLAQ